jgi:Cdc6-like AAA superfamily ATPase
VGLERSAAFQGRTSERQELDRLLDKARAGESATLVIRGEAGVGKTALCGTRLGRLLAFELPR